MTNLHKWRLIFKNGQEQSDDIRYLQAQQAVFGGFIFRNFK